MTPSVPTAATPRRLPPVGSFAWAVDVCGQAMLDWRSGLRPLAVFIASAAGLILALASAELPGGTMPALPVLLVTVVHHSVALLLRRVAGRGDLQQVDVDGACGSGGGGSAASPRS